MGLSSVQRRIDEGTTPVYSATLRDEASVAIPLASISTIQLTYYDRGSGTVINSRDDQNVKNANNVTIHATSGLLTWSLQPEDTAIIGTSWDAGDVETHIALFEWTLTNGKRGKKEVRFDVINLKKVGSD